MLLAAQSRLKALTADLDQLRNLTARIGEECRRMEFASREAARDLERRRLAQRELAPMVMEAAPVFQAALTEISDLGAQERERERKREAAEWRWARETREKSTAWVRGAREKGQRVIDEVAAPRAVLVRWPSVSAIPRFKQTFRIVMELGVPLAAAVLLVVSLVPASRRSSVILSEDLPSPAASAASGETSPSTLAARIADVSPFSAAAREPKRTEVVPALRTVPVAAGPVYQGTLSVQSEPAGATVFVNQTYVGETPLKLPRLRAGSHVVWVQGEGYRRWSAGVLVPADKVTNVRVNLERENDR
jgi:PEGA domain